MNTFTFDVLPFLVAPILFYLWLLLGYFMDTQMLIFPKDCPFLTIFLSAGTIPLGFLLSNITIFILRIWFWIIRGCHIERWKLKSIDGDNFEAIARGGTKSRILGIIGPTQHKNSTFKAEDDNFNLYILAVYTNEKFNKDLQQWFSRRDKVFTTLCNCITALFSAYLLGIFLGLQDYNFHWFVVTLSMVVILYFNARITRRQLCGLVNFASYRNSGDVIHNSKR